MTKRFIFLSFFLMISALMILNSCKKDDMDTIPVVVSDNTIFIINEGPFQNGNGSLSIYDRETEEVIHNVFEQINGFPLGNLVQSVDVHNDKVYIVVNNANKIEVANKDYLVSSGTIEGVNLPRYFLGIDENKAYVTSWDNKVYVIDLNTNMISKSIHTATGPEKMMKIGDEVWVLNQGGYSYDSTITIINSVTDEVITNLVVGHKPSGIIQDKDGKVWVMCSGNGWNGVSGDDNSYGRLVCIDPDHHQIINTLIFPDTDQHPEKLVVDANGETAYFNYPGGLYSQNLYEELLELKVVLSSQTMYYGLGYDNVTETVFVTDPSDYIENGKVYIVDPVGEEILKFFDAGVIPAEMYFNSVPAMGE